MEKSEISVQECLIFSALSTRTWKTILGMTKESGVPRRTVNSMMLKFLHLGLIDLAEVFPRHHYKLSKLASKRNLAYLTRIKSATKVFKNSEEFQKWFAKNSKEK